MRDLSDNMSILEQTAPGLSDQLRRLSAEQRRRVFIKTGETLSHSIDSLEPSIQTLLKTGLDCTASFNRQLAQLNDYAEEADKRYLTLKEEGVDKSVWRNWFAKARLATALISVFSNDGWESAADAAYELCFIEEDNSRAIRLIESAIRTEHEFDTPTKAPVVPNKNQTPG